MYADIVIDEIRAVRQKISEEFGHDTEALVRHYMELEKQYQGPKIAPPPVPAPLQALMTLEKRDASA